MIQTVQAKLGNMRKSVEWVVYPVSHTGQRERVIQSDNRIAKVNIDTGTAILSDGKGGHPSYARLSATLGATACSCPSDVLEQLRALPEQVGPITLSGSV